MNNDSRIDKLKRREAKGALKCPMCPPHKCENARRKATHGKTKPKRKDKRK